jgi:Uma2 family endonuclease
MPISFETYQRVALEDPEGQWELVCGRLREKPVMTMKHGFTERLLLAMLNAQLDRREWSVGSTRLRISRGTYYVPDITVLRMSQVRSLPADKFEVYEEPVPLVVEIWSPSTSNYDVDDKLPEYQLRGDIEIWRIHPFDKELTVWRKQPDATYAQEVLRGGLIEPIALPGVTVDLDELFA